MDIKYRIFDRDRGSWKLTWKMRNLFFFWWNDWWKQNLAFVLFEVMDVRFSIT